MKSPKSEIKDIDSYIAASAAQVRAPLQQLRSAIARAAPEAVEKISYRIPSFALEGNLVHFAAFANHIGFYPGASGISEFRDELSGYEVSKGTVRFALGQALPLRLVARIVKFRVRENLDKAAAKKRSR